MSLEKAYDAAAAKAEEVRKARISELKQQRKAIDKELRKLGVRKKSKKSKK